MVLSLPVPFYRSSVSPPRPADGSPAQSRHRSSASSSSSSSSRIWKPALGQASSPNHTITFEALRNNPFGNSRCRSAPLSLSETEEQRREQEELNAALETLVRVFPDVKVEVFRELLVHFDGQSRVQVCIEELLRNKKKWVSGRWNIPEGNSEADADGNARAGLASYPDDITWSEANQSSLVPPEERFRSDEYKATVRNALTKEFNSLSRSIIDAVLAEANYSYARARPTLRDLSRRTWRATINSLLPFRRKKDRDEHPFIAWHRRADGEMVPGLRETGCTELDGELHEMLLAPLIRQKREEQENKDFIFASDLNEKEAQAVDALYECECCFADVTFEQIATCSANAHIICYHCIQRTVYEALFGQGWGKSVNLERSTLKCLAPLSVGSCDGCLHPQIVQQAILLDTAGLETYRKFEDRLSSEALLKSQMKLIRCPFCSYAEIDPLYHPSTRGVCWRIRRDGGIIPTILMTLLLLDLIPLFLIPVLILIILDPAALTTIFGNSIRNLCLKMRPKRFICANPSCLRISCMTCQKLWRDPHVCHEPLLLDLRATVEAARTAAVKRTCPRCCLSFVKSSGCNKLTCVCGYSMCYLCRKALGPPIRQSRPGHRRENAHPPPGRGYDGLDDEPNPFDEQAGNFSDDDEFEEPEGYQHFCEHFRINPGSRCTECTKCNLYQAEDEEAVARRAGEKAEREWRIRQGVSADNATASAVEFRNINQDLSAGTDGFVNRRASTSLWDMQFRKSARPWDYWLIDIWSHGRWKLEGQAFVDWVVERIVVIDEV